MSVVMRESMRMRMRMRLRMRNLLQAVGADEQVNGFLTVGHPEGLGAHNVEGVKLLILFGEPEEGT